MTIAARARQAGARLATASLRVAGTALAVDGAAGPLTATPKPKFSLAAGTYQNVRTVQITDTGQSAKT
jgi:hypothetical protein